MPKRKSFNRKKWKEFSIITELSVGTIIGEATWTTFLVFITNKIPYIGNIISFLLGITGIFCIFWLGNNSRFAYQDWYKEYCIEK